MHILGRFIAFLGIVLIASTVAYGQAEVREPSFFEPADTFHKKRFNLALTAAATTYTGFSIALYNTWYREYPRTSFHFFDDWGEWKNMDKFGHVYTAYFQGTLCYKGAKWTGLSEGKSILVGAICGGLFQSTIEVMDGFSSQWGFSVSDFSANLLGIGAFTAQQKLWGEQRIALKVSSWPKDYSTARITSSDGQLTTTLQERATDLYGHSFAEQFLKDYNAQTVWVSFNIQSFVPSKKGIPDWLNVALGYGAENMYGGFDNSWAINDSRFVLSEVQYPRYNQYFLSFDVDLTRIRVKSPFLKTVLTVLNIFKLPAPTLEYDSLGNLKFHFLFL